jgi:predicted GTPase
MRYAVADVGDALNSCTQEVRAFGCLHPDGSGRKVVIVDTPGLNDTERSDRSILETIAQWLEQT